MDRSLHWRRRASSIAGPPGRLLGGLNPTTRNRDLVLGARVTLEQEGSDVDRFGQLLRDVRVANQLVQSALLKEGQVRSYPLAPNVRYRDDFAAAEGVARTQGLGQWANCSVLHRL